MATIGSFRERTGSPGIRRALVLGAGGFAATAWELGLVAGLSDGGVDVRNADVLVGTSAGSTVAVQLASGATIDELYRLQIEPRQPSGNLEPSMDLARLRSSVASARQGASGPVDALRRVGALAAPPMSWAKRRDAMALTLRQRDWPARTILIAVVDADRGERRTFDRESGVPLVDAVAASCAVPGIWPPPRIDGRRYIAGGIYSIDNADLASGCDRVLVLTLRSRVPPICVVSLEAGMSTLRAMGARVEVILPDEASEAAFASVGGNVLDPRVREAAARAGRAQGCRVAARAASLWN